MAQENHLDRERVSMLNVTQAVELCLKAIMTHASYRENGIFKFDAGHNVTQLFAALPPSLKVHIHEESRVFARSYVEFRTEVETDIARLRAQTPRPVVNREELREVVEDWERLERRIRESSYTAFLNSNDPAASQASLHDDWFHEAMTRVTEEENKAGISEYCRYAPPAEEDELPVDPIHWMFVLGRFFDEHLFPVPLSNATPLRTFLSPR